MKTDFVRKRNIQYKMMNYIVVIIITSLIDETDNLDLNSTNITGPALVVMTVQDVTTQVEHATSSSDVTSQTNAQGLEESSDEEATVQDEMTQSLYATTSSYITGLNHQELNDTLVDDNTTESLNGSISTDVIKGKVIRQGTISETISGLIHNDTLPPNVIKTQEIIVPIKVKFLSKLPFKAPSPWPKWCMLLVGYNGTFACYIRAKNATSEEAPYMYWPFDIPKPTSWPLCMLIVETQTLACHVTDKTDSSNETIFMEFKWLHPFLPDNCILNNLFTLRCCQPFKEDRVENFNFQPKIVNRVSFVTYFCFSLPICMFGVIGSVLSFTVLSKHKLNTSILILKALAISDGIYCLWYITFDLYFEIYERTNLVKDRENDSVHAIPMVFVYLRTIKHSVIFISIWLVVLLMIDRYIVVCKPLMAKSLCSIKKSTIEIIILIIFSIGIHFPKYFSWLPTLIQNRCTGEKMVKHFIAQDSLGPSKMYQYLYNICFTGLTRSIIPVVLVGALALKVVFGIKKASKHRSKMVGSGVISACKRENQLSRLLIAIATMFTILIIPGVIRDIMYGLQLSYYFTDLILPIDFKDFVDISFCVRAVADLCLTLNASLNFVIYTVANREFRNNLVSLMHCASTSKGKQLKRVTSSRKQVMTTKL